jgi:hypothetical protein
MVPRDVREVLHECSSKDRVTANKVHEQQTVPRDVVEGMHCQKRRVEENSVHENPTVRYSLSLKRRQ